MRPPAKPHAGMGGGDGAVRIAIPGTRPGALSGYSFAAIATDRLFALLLAALIAAVFGASEQTDAFFFASLVALTIGAVLMEASYTTALPQLMTNGKVATALRSSWQASAFLFLSYVATLLVVRPAHFLIWLVLSPLALLLGFTGAYAALLVRDGRYAVATMRVPAASGVAVVLIAVSLTITPSLATAAACVTLAYAAVLLGLVLVERGARDLPIRPSAGRAAGDVWRAFGAALLATAAGSPAVILGERAIASALEEGSVTHVACARGLASLALLVPAAIASGLFSVAVEHVRSTRPLRLAQAALVSVRLGLLSALVLAAFVVAHRRELVGLALERGQFDAADADATARLVAVMAVSVVGSAAAILGARVLFALNRRRLVTLIGGGIVLGYLAVAPPLAVASGAVGLAAAHTIVSAAGGAVTLGAMLRVLPLSASEAARQWLLAPALLTVPFLVGVGVADWLIPESPDLGWSGLTVFASFGLGLGCLAAAVAVTGSAELRMLQQMVRRGPR